MEMFFFGENLLELNSAPSDPLLTELRLWQILIIVPFNFFYIFYISYNRIPL